MKKVFLLLNFLCFLLLAYCQTDFSTLLANDNKVIQKNIILNAKKRFQVIDGFGVNITPAQWRDGNLKTVIDSLVDDLGSTIFRFDCYGMANWLDPARLQHNGNYPATYLQKVYNSTVFRNAWAAFRYLNSKGIEPIFNVSGAVPPEWTIANGKKHDRLKNFEGYAIMVTSLLKWAREKEGLKFSYFMPFNETDLGFPEGPRLLDEDCAPALAQVLQKMEENGLNDVKCIVMDDTFTNLERIKRMLEEVNYTDKIKGIGVHNYGDGFDEDFRNGWDKTGSQYQIVKNFIDSSKLKSKSFILSEYGDLDQTGETEFAIGWRSTRRLLKVLNDGMTGGVVWDAFDNFHEHDTTWTYFGLLKTDTIKWTYQAKERYYAAKHIYKYVRPGFQRIEIESPDDKKLTGAFQLWTRTLQNMLLSAFVSKDGKDFTITGMSTVESDVELNISLQGFRIELNNAAVNCYQTTSKNHFKKLLPIKINGDIFKIKIPANSMFTITTLQ